VLLSRQPVIEQRLHDLSFDKREPRGLVDADVLRDGRRWRVLATHLGLSWRERHRQLARVARLLSQDTRPTTILGDFNIWLGSRAFAPLARLGFVQCKVRSYPTWFAPLLSLDRVLVRPPARLLRCERFESNSARIASDHYPVVAELVIDVD
jgi:endonuclease/exonuclease/phosphatase family metal-dependent hydrolase